MSHPPISHPVVYDINTDIRRPVTQDDVDRWVEIEITYGKMLNFLRNEHNKLMLTVKRPTDA